MDGKRLSVVIPTYNRRARLARVLSALERQLPEPAFEVVVVDDGSSDGTTEWLASRSFRFSLKALKLANGGPARARNAGVEAASGTFVLFIDDDVVPAERLVAEHLRLHDAERDIVVIGPLASLPHYAQPWVAYEQAKVEEQYAAMERGDWAPSFRQFWTGNSSVARQHVVDAGGFNIAFLRAEDVELGVRLKKMGLEFRYNPLARGLHYAERSLSSWEHAHSSYGKAEVAILGALGEDALLHILTENWGRLHPATRWLVERCLDRPLRHAALRTLLRGHLHLAAWLPLPLLSDKACGVFANLLYWQASAETLGPDRAARVMRRTV